MPSLIITERYLKENSVINDNADAKVITPTIFIVQDLYIHPILGTDLYEEIQTQVAADNVSAANQTLLDNYILPCLVQYVLCECSPVFQYRYMNKGVMQKSSDNSQPVDLGVIKYMMEKWKNNAESYAQRATKFLCANSDDYPLYIANTDADDIQPNKNNFNSSLFLEDDDCDCPGYYS